MESKRKALGRGLEQLFNSENLDFNQLETSIVENASKDEIVQVNLNELRVIHINHVRFLMKKP